MSYMPTRLFFNGAREMHMDVEEIHVQSLETGTASAAAQAKQLYQMLNMVCSSTSVLDLPRMSSPVSEKTSHVEFYVGQYVLRDIHADDGNASTSYWRTALSAEDALNVGNVSSSSTRRLFSRQGDRRLQELDGGFEVEFGENAMLSASVSGGCLSVAGELKSAVSPWSFNGEINIGRGCSDPASQFTVDGRVGVSYGWEVEQKYKINKWGYTAEVDFSCGLSIGGYIGAKVGSYKYNCGRRLSASSHERSSNDTTAGSKSIQHFNEIAEVSGLGPHSQILPLEVDSHGSLGEEAGDGEDNHVENDTASARRLWWGPRRRRRRRRQCTVLGFEILAGVGIGGGCGVSRRRIGASLDGGLDLMLGPWPRPLDDRARAEISAKACIKLGPFKGCIGLPTKKLFDMNI